MLQKQRRLELPCRPVPELRCKHRCLGLLLFLPLFLPYNCVLAVSPTCGDCWMRSRTPAHRLISTLVTITSHRKRSPRVTWKTIFSLTPSAEPTESVIRFCSTSTTRPLTSVPAGAGAAGEAVRFNGVTGIIYLAGTPPVATRFSSSFFCSSNRRRSASSDCSWTIFSYRSAVI